jgi:hypothetical protein
VVRIVVALSVALGCSGNKTTPPKPVRDDARRDANVADAVVLRVDPSGKGDVQIRVEWKDVPVAARAAPGRTTCGTSRPAAVAPTTTWGIGDVFVAIDVPAPAKGSAHRVVLGECVLSPRVVVSSGTVAIASAMQAPARATLQRAGRLPLGSALADDKPRDVFLPIAGHEVEVALDANAIYRIAAGDESAWIVASDHPFIAVTETTGTVILRDVPAGTHAVSAWLPPRSGQSARVAKGTVTVTDGALADVTLDITKQ